ncbi:C-C chemokine receptor type 5-like [Paramacrobiotus metropolitanus]|uniref:C-C chemokine receptor type 5-like n=1 Tax=Paramacrobiotus metropolitanus TaxID=2943436 RepID=UPI002445DCD2|nr:C-C chemokine receptor type 5-like [Paramacrobiotus metropolitanus]
MNRNGTLNHTGDSRSSVWQALPILDLLLLLIGLLLNLTVLALYATHRRLRSTFSIYILNLTFASLLFLALYGPLHILSTTASGGHWTLSDTACTVFLYSTNAPPAIIIQAHLLIVANRLWALTRPLHYRHHHTPVTALLLSVTAWVLPHSISLPGIVLDAGERPPVTVTGVCMLDVDRLRVWAIVGEILLAIAPIGFMVAANVFLLCRQHKRRKQRVARALSLQRSTRLSVHIRDTEQPTAAGGHLPGKAADASKEAQENAAPREPKGGLLLLAGLTVSLLICWLPSVGFASVNIFIRVKLPHAGIRGIAGLLFLLQTALDPLVLILTSAQLRHATHRLLCSGRCRAQ